MELHNADDLTELTESAVALLVDAGWIHITREWWRYGHAGRVDMRERLDRADSDVRSEWKFPTTDWREIISSRVPSPGIKSASRIVARIDSDADLHLIEFTLTKKARVRNYR